MPGRAYDAILLDLDGTLVDEQDRMHPRTLQSLRVAAAAGARVMISTGRSELATQPVLDALDLHEPAIVFNGAGLWCGRRRRFLEERTLSERTLARAVEFGRARGLLTVTMCAGRKFAVQPVRAEERSALRDMTGLQFVEPAELVGKRAIRVTLFSEGSAAYAGSEDFCAEVVAHLESPVYVTHFPLNALPHHRESRLLVVDVHPPCRGKGEALRYLEETHGIPAARVIAVGDATNDLPMLTGAGLAVAMRASMPEVHAIADRVIGEPGDASIGALVDELLLIAGGS